MDVSILTVNWHAYDFAALLIESVMYCSKNIHPIIIVDNSTKFNPFFEEYTTKPFIRYFPQHKNLGHGEGINIGLSKIETDYVFILDIDCHILCKNWENELFGISADVVAGKGVEIKPLRPSCIFTKTDIAKSYDWRPTPGYRGHRITPEGYDVGIIAYHQMIKEQRTIHWMHPWPNRYDTTHSEEWYLNEKPILYHHWHGSHLKIRQDEDYPDEDLIANRNKLFNQFPFLKDKLRKLDIDYPHPLEVP